MRAVPVLERQRLLAQLTRSLEASRVILLRAPAGYGKSVAVDQWLEQRPEQALRIGCSAASAETLWRYVAQRLARALGAEVPTPDFPLGSVRELINDIEQPFILVLDDYHRVTDAENDQLIAALAECNPLLTFVVVARRVRVLDGPLVTSRAPVRVFGPRELVFRPAESRELAELLGVDDESLPAALHEADGWPLAVRAALGPVSAAGEAALDPEPGEPSPRAESLDPLAELSRFALNHLEIVSETGRHALFAASLLDAVSFNQLEEFTGAPVPQLRDTVHQLLELGVLVAVSHGTGTEFRCHPAVRAAFAMRSERSLSAEQRARLLHGRAVELERTDPFTAFKLYSSVGDHDRAELVLAHHFIAMTDRFDELIAYLRAAPEPVLGDHPAFTAARLLLETGDSSVPTSTLEHILELLRTGVRRRLADPPSSTADGVAPEVPDELRVPTIAQKMVVSRLLGDLDTARASARELETRITSTQPLDFEDTTSSPLGPNPPEPVNGPLEIYYREIALTALALNDTERARSNWGRMLAHAEARIAVSPFGSSSDSARSDPRLNHRWRLAALNGMAFTEMIDGRMTRCAELLEEHDRYSEEIGSSPPAAAWVVGEIARSHLAYESADEAALQQSFARLAPMRDRIEAWPLMLIGEAEAVRMRRGADWALSQLMTELERSTASARYGGGTWFQSITCYRAMLSTVLGDLAGTAELLGALDPAAPSTQLERARLALFSLDDVQALLLAQQIGAACTTVRQQGDRALITAIAAWGCGRRQEAFEALRAAIEIVRRHRLPSLLWSAPHDVLRELAEAARDADVADALPEVDAVPTPARCRRYERLTEMELRTLAAISVHRSISDTADSLYVTSATVKKHLNAVYRKLQVRGREEAILQATRMGLLSAA
ncbi:hypothetical protein [Leucobacter sp. wl10]|uniref:hypothetical protein n=1 Tax=Leucobacter sp. wl10 TaxID=2304677 RepID=UPI000E5A56BD|nr:hypothetical protein [Leucobacter sp. wl10]RGE19812.1 hypothetical protein D1J51_10610 [Leucobacter sp. wl10]